MSSSKKKNRKPSEYVSRRRSSRSPDRDEVQYVDAKCVYCGRRISAHEPSYLVRVREGKPPVCSTECRDAAREYIKADVRYKKYFYYSLTLTALLIIIGGLFFNRSLYIMGVGIAVAGLGMLLFPYPISYFESFYSLSIRKVTLLTRIIGAILLTGGLFFIIAHAMGR